MVSAHYIRLFDFFKQQFNIDKPHTEIFVEVVENIVEEKFDNVKNNFSSRTDIQELKHHVELLRQETKAAIAESKSELKSDINKLIIWIVSTGIAIVGLIFAFLKL